MTTGKELIYETLRHQQTERVPWVPFAGIHAGVLKGYSPTEVLTDSKKHYEALMEVVRLYQPDGLPVCFDLQLEAEILGCRLQWADNAPPAVCSHPHKDSDTLPDHIPQQQEGRLSIVFETLRRLKASVGEEIALYGLFCGPLTLASHLRGSGLFMDFIRKQAYAQSLVDWCTDVAIAMADYYLDAGADVVASVDPLISQISPRHFEQFCMKPYTRLFDHIRARGGLSSFFVCGNAIKNLEVMCQSGPDALSVDENVDLARAKEITDRHQVAIGGNIPLTTVMLYGNQQDNMKYVVDLLDSVDHKNLIISPGCDMPYDVPVHNAVACSQAVHNAAAARLLVADYERGDDLDQIPVELPDYGALKKPLVELFTLDPLSCAACTYMLAVWEQARAVLGTQAGWGEYRYNRREDIARMRKLGVKNLPSLYINGSLCYDSLIPTVEELVTKIRAKG